MNLTNLSVQTNFFSKNFSLFINKKDSTFENLNRTR